MSRVEHTQEAALGGARPHPLFARCWSRISSRVGGERQRREMLEGLSGRVLEVGAGDGLNFRYYPAEVAEVVAIEPEPYLRGLAERAAERAPVSVTVLAGAAEALPLKDGACDAAVTSLVLCSVEDQQRALAEVARVIGEEGELRFLEHVVAHHPVGSAVQRGLDGSGVWPLVGGGCHLSRDTLASLAAAGFNVTRVRRFGGAASMGIPFVLGAAVRARGG